MEGSNLAEKPVECMNGKQEELNREHDGVDETVEGENCIKDEDLEDKEDTSVHKLAVEHSEVVQDETLIQGEGEKAVEPEGDKNEAVEQADESKEVAPQKVVEPKSESNEVVEQDNVSKELVLQGVSKQDDENRSTVRDAAEEEKEEMTDAISVAEMKSTGEDDQTSVAKDVTEEETEDNNEVKEGKTNNGVVDEEKTELDQEHKADTSENKSVEVASNAEEKDVDLKNGSEIEQLEGKLEGSSNEEDKKEGNNVSKKRKRKGSAANKTKDEKKDKKSETTPIIPVSTRPVRERKSVERLVASIEKDVVREIFVEKGPGVALKDIPNVAYKLSKKKNDDTFKLLHTILFGRRGKAIQMKNHVSQFSGFVWHDNEEKNKMKVKEKFDKLVKEKLIDFCDVLDISIANKISMKKEEVVAKIMDFLTSPYSTTKELLSEKEHSGKTTKRKRSAGSAKISKKQRREASGNPKDSGKSDSDSDGESDKEEDEVVTENQGSGNGKLNRLEGESSERKSSESEDATAEDDKQHRQRSKKTSVKVNSLAKKQTKPKTPKKPDLDDSEEAKKVDAENQDQSPNKPSEKKGSARKARSSNSNDEKKKRIKPFLEKEPNRKTKTAAPKGKSKEEKLKPSDKVLRNQICHILKEVDFNTATFTDILKMLGKHFKTDLTPRKAAIKLIIQEELTKLADAADDDEDEEQDVTPEPAKVDA